MSARLVAIAFALLVLAGCATTRQVAGPAAAVLEGAALDAAQARLAAREQALRAQPAVAFSGRVALAKGREGGSGRIEWRQQGGGYRVTLSAPVTRQSWTLRLSRAGAVLEGVPNGPLAGPDAGALLHQVTGWQIPVEALGCWLRGARAGAAFGPAEIVYGADGRPLRIQQGGWRIAYDGWGEHGGHAVPTRVDAQRGDDRVRLVVDRWGAQ